MFVDTDAAGPTGGAGEGSLDALEERIGRLAADISAATCRWLGLIAEFSRREGHLAWGFASCSSWLAWRCGLDPRSAREHVRVAEALEALPRIRGEFAEGRLSYSKVRALTRVASAEMEADLVEIARHASAAQLERVLRGYAGAISAAAEARIQERRGLDLRWQDDGSLRVAGVLTAEEGALLAEALEAAREELWREAGPDSQPPGRVDALVALAESGLARGLQSTSGGDRHQVVVHVDAETLSGGDEADDPDADPGRRSRPLGTPMIGDGGALGDETARRISCDASIVTLLERDGVPLSVGRRSRSIPSAIVRALRSRDGGCRFPGCGHRRFVDAHHIEHWAHGGATSMDNLVQLCRRHHRAIHAGDFEIEADGAAFVFRRRDGMVIEAVPPLAAGTMPSRDWRSGVSVRGRPPIADPRIDHDLAVTLLASRARPD